MLIPPAGEQLSGMDPRVSVRVEQLTPKPIRTRFLGTHVYKILEMEIPRSRTRVSGSLLSIPALKGPYLVRCVRLYLRKCFFPSMGVCSIVIGMERKVHVEWIQKEYKQDWFASLYNLDAFTGIMVKRYLDYYFTDTSKSF